MQRARNSKREPGDTDVPVVIRYDPANPKRADIEGLHHPWRPVLALLVLAVGVLTIAWQAGAMPETRSGEVASEFVLP